MSDLMNNSFPEDASASSTNNTHPNEPPTNTPIGQDIEVLPPAPNTLVRTSAGTILGQRYVLLSRIAIGGMGEVWQARDTATNQLVAIKVLREELAGQEPFLARLRTEAANAKPLKHPNLCQVFSSGQDNGFGWIAMELIQGIPLTDLLSNGAKLSPQLMLSVLQQTARALDVVHKAGIVHRDIKPANILITPDGMVKLTDFGISRANQQLTLTQPGMVMGTAQYLAPEQALGKPASPVGDLYSLGIIAYESLSGHRPFTGSSQVEIASAHVNNPVPPLPASVPVPLARLVMSLLSKDPRSRPATAMVLVNRIDQVIDQMALTDANSVPRKAAIRAELLQAAAQLEQSRFADSPPVMPPSIHPEVSSGEVADIAQGDISLMPAAPPFASEGRADDSPSSPKVAAGPAGDATVDDAGDIADIEANHTPGKTASEIVCGTAKNLEGNHRQLPNDYDQLKAMSLSYSLFDPQGLAPARNKSSSPLPAAIPLAPPQLPPAPQPFADKAARVSGTVPSVAPTSDPAFKPDTLSNPAWMAGTFTRQNRSNTTQAIPSRNLDGSIASTDTPPAKDSSKLGNAARPTDDANHPKMTDSSRTAASAHSQLEPASKAINNSKIRPPTPAQGAATPTSYNKLSYWKLVQDIASTCTKTIIVGYNWIVGVLTPAPPTHARKIKTVQEWLTAQRLLLVLVLVIMLTLCLFFGSVALATMAQVFVPIKEPLKGKSWLKTPPVVY